LRTGGICTIVLDSNSRQIDKLCKSVSLFEATDAYSMITVGASVPALQINYGTGVITALSSVQPLTLQFNFLQRKLIRNSEVHTFALWCPSTGMSVSKTNQGLGIGVSMVPLGIHIDAVSFGLGAMYTAVDKITEPTRSNFSVIIPVTYALF
jgi:hypothetical protein